MTSTVTSAQALSIGRDSVEDQKTDEPQPGKKDSNPASSTTATTTTRTTTAQQQRERFLDRFPLKDSELDTLLEFWKILRRRRSNNEKALLRTDDNDDDKNKSNSWSMFRAYYADSSGAESHLLHELLSQEEEPVAIQSMLDWSMDNVFLMGFEEDDNGKEEEKNNNNGTDHDEETTHLLPTRKTAIFLEAAVSLLGRRGEGFLHSVLYNHGNNIINNDSNGDIMQNSDSSLHTLYQLIRFHCRVQAAAAGVTPAAGVAAASQTTTTKATTVAPSNWMASLRTMAIQNNDDSNNDNMALLLRDKGKASTQEKTKVSWSTWKRWLTGCAPWLHTVVPTVFHTLWFGASSSSSSSPINNVRMPCWLWSMPQFSVPVDWDVAFVPAHPQRQLDHHHLSYTVPLAAMLGPLGSHCYGLYSSFQHGLAFPTLQQALLGYTGPTLLIVSGTPKASVFAQNNKNTTTDDQPPPQDNNTDDSFVFGYFTQAPWKCGSGWHGRYCPNDDDDPIQKRNKTIGRCRLEEEECRSNDAFLFTLHPVWQMFPRSFEEAQAPRSRGGAGVQWLQTNLGATKSSTPTSPVRESLEGPSEGGLAVGRGILPNRPRLRLTESLEHGSSLSATDHRQPFAAGNLFVQPPPVAKSSSNDDDRPTGTSPELPKDEAHCVFFDIHWIDVYAVVQVPATTTRRLHDDDGDDDDNNEAASTSTRIDVAARAIFESKRAAGQRILDVQEGRRQKWAQVDRAQFVEDLATCGTNNNLFVHRDQARGRAAFVADDDDGYYVEGKAPSPTARRPSQQQEQKQQEAAPIHQQSSTIVEQQQEQENAEE